jgi:DNA-binding response OmpR family regulator
MKPRVLIIEDDPSIRLGLQELLGSEGFETSVCLRGDCALETIQREAPGLILLDVMLPKVNGYEVCRLLRQAGIRTPILMLTAKGQEMDKVIGLDAGADDYVTKPFGVRELLARIQALLRRATNTAPTPSPPTDAPFRIGACEVSPRTFQLRRHDEVLDLTPRELQLLQLFHRHPGEVLSRDRLLTEVWGQRYYGTTRTLDQVIVQLRRKLGDPGDAPRHLLTVHGVGYKLAETA